MCLYIALWVHFSALRGHHRPACCAPAGPAPSPPKIFSRASSQSKCLPAFRSFQRRWNSSYGGEAKDSWSEEDELFSDAGKNKAPTAGVN